MSRKIEEKKETLRKWGRDKGLKAMKELKKGGKGKKRKEVQRSTYMN
jgi:hypothetical protein